VCRSTECAVAGDEEEAISSAGELHTNDTCRYGAYDGGFVTARCARNNNMEMDGGRSNSRGSWTGRAWVVSSETRPGGRGRGQINLLLAGLPLV